MPALDGPLGDQDHLVVVGASLAGLRAVEGARAAGFAGDITLVGAEEHLPYDRPPLTKEVLTDGEAPPLPLLRDEQSYADELRTTLRLGTTALRLDPDRRTLQLDDGELPFSALVIATGARPRRLPVDGQDLPGVHVVRTVDDARAVHRDLADARQVVVVGAGFIGSEVASAARARGLDVTVLEAAPTPLAHAVGARFGATLAELHGRHGTTVRCGAAVTGLDGTERVEAVRLADGSSVPADLVVVGVGAEPVVEWLEGSGVEVDDGVRCDATLATSVPGVYAAGDVARWHNPLFDRSMRLEHWTNAAEQGGAAGRHAVDPDSAQPFGSVPYFWSDLYGSRVQLVGVPSGEADFLVGDADAESWLALYVDGDRLVGALGLNATKLVMRARVLLGKRASTKDAREKLLATAEKARR